MLYKLASLVFLKADSVSKFNELNLGLFLLLAR
jgi:hypothetical protein